MSQRLWRNRDSFDAIHIDSTRWIFHSSFANGIWQKRAVSWIWGPGEFCALYFLALRFKEKAKSHQRARAISKWLWSGRIPLQIRISHPCSGTPFGVYFWVENTPCKGGNWGPIFWEIWPNYAISCENFDSSGVTRRRIGRLWGRTAIYGG